jgi:hypothetical protein
MHGKIGRDLLFQKWREFLFGTSFLRIFSMISVIICLKNMIFSEKRDFEVFVGSTKYLQRRSTAVQYIVKYFFLFESSSLRLASLVARFLK